MKLQDIILVDLSYTGCRTDVRNWLRIVSFVSSDILSTGSAGTVFSSSRNMGWKTRFTNNNTHKRAPAQAKGLAFVFTYIFFHVALRPNAVHGLFILEVSRSHTTTHHDRKDSSGRGIRSSQRPLRDNTQQTTDKHPRPGGI
jgi:hypothetical protein